MTIKNALETDPTGKTRKTKPRRRKKSAPKQPASGQLLKGDSPVLLSADGTPKAGRKIAILGTTPSRMMAPLADDSGWEIWTIGPGGKDHHRWDRLYEIHTTWPADFGAYLDDLRAIEAPQTVFSLVPIQDAKSNAIINRELLFEKYGRMWFSSSISYAIAVAIEEGCADMGLWGIDLESTEEFQAQFPGCKFFLTLARLAGINVHLPAHSSLLRDPAPYPDRYETNFALTTEKKQQWLQHMLEQLEPQFDQQKAEIHRQEGRIIAMRAMDAEAKDIQEAERVLVHNNIHLGQQAAQVNQLKGEVRATEFYRRMYVYNVCDPQDRLHLETQPSQAITPEKIAKGAAVLGEMETSTSTGRPVAEVAEAIYRAMIAK